MNSFAILLVCCLGASMASPLLFDSELDKMWEMWKQSHNRAYDGDSENMRRFIWERHLVYINQHNMEADMGKHTYRLGMNEYGDLTTQEYNQVLKGYKRTNETRVGSAFIEPSNLDMPKTVDWRDEGYVTPVKNQGQCGSCWAFSATGSMEGQFFKKTGKLDSISEQNLVDCSRPEGNMGCEGGIMDNAFTYVKDNHGIDSESSYPYEARDATCRFKKSSVVTDATGFVDIPQGSESALKKAVASIGPISVAIDASHPSFQFYKTGVYVEPDCSSVQLDHGVLVVGYGTEHGKAYWLVKNSWGKSWGDEGYIKMARNHDNMCGIATNACYPLL